MNITTRYKKPNVVIFGATLFGMLLFGVGSNAWAIDLQTSYQQALQNDSTFAAATAERRAVASGVSLAKAQFKPNLSVRLNTGRREIRSFGRHHSTNENLTALSINQLIYDRAKWLSINSSKQQATIAELRLQTAQQDLILETATQYFNVLNAQDEQRVATATKTAILRQLELAQERFDVGLNTETDVFDAQARYQQALAREIQTDSQTLNQLALLTQTIGQQPDYLSKLQQQTPLLLPIADIEKWQQRAIEQSLAVQIAQIGVDQAQQQLKIARAQTYSPIVSLNAEQSHVTNEDVNNSIACNNNANCRTRSITLNVNIPVYSGGAGRAKIEQQKNILQQREHLLENARRQAITNVVSAYLSVNNSINRVHALSEAITAGEKALQSKEAGFRSGLTTNIDVLNAQRDLSRSQTDHLRARYNYILASLQLELSVGDLDEADITKVNQWLVQ